jgi:hypothetical protein
LDQRKIGILEIGKINRYSNNNIQKITARREKSSTFHNSANQNPMTEKMSVPFFPAITNGMKKSLNNIKLI